jgi:hypothetical protein
LIEDREPRWRAVFGIETVNDLILARLEISNGGSLGGFQPTTGEKFVCAVAASHGIIAAKEDKIIPGAAIHSIATGIDIGPDGAGGMQIKTADP